MLICWFLACKSADNSVVYGLIAGLPHPIILAVERQPMLKRLQFYKILDALLPFIAALCALIVGAVILILLDTDPVEAYNAMITGAFGNKNGLADTLVKATPLLLVALGIVIAFRASVINIGAEGQLIMGALIATYLGVTLGETMPGWLVIVITIVAGTLMGAFWAAIPGYLKAHLRVNEILTTIMMNQIAIQIGFYLLRGPMIDPAEVDKNVKTDLDVLGNAKESLAMLLPEINKNSHEDWLQKFKDLYAIEFEKIIKEDLNPTKEGLTMGEVIRAINEESKGSAAVVSDVGQHQMIACRYAEFNQTKSNITSGGLGTMGFALPAAIGAKMAAPDRDVVAIIGDGGYQMNIQELGTIFQTKVPIKIVVLNNNFLGMVRQWQQLWSQWVR